MERAAQEVSALARCACGAVRDMVNVMNMLQATEEMIKVQRQVVFPSIFVIVLHLVSRPIQYPIHPMLSFSAERKKLAPREPGTYPSAPPPTHHHHRLSICTPTHLSTHDTLWLQDAELRDLTPMLKSKTVHPSI